MHGWDTDEYRAHEQAARDRLRETRPEVDRLSVTCRAGWLPLVDLFIAEAVAAMPPGARLGWLRARESCGVLSMSYQAGPAPFETLHRDIQEIEARVTELSMRTCEVCGEPGRVLRRPSSGWFVTRCEAHAEGAVALRGEGDLGC